MEATVTIPLKHYKELESNQEFLHEKIKSGDFKVFYCHHEYGATSYCVKKENVVIEELISEIRGLRETIKNLRDENRELERREITTGLKSIFKSKWH